MPNNTLSLSIETTTKGTEDVSRLQKALTEVTTTAGTMGQSLERSGIAASSAFLKAAKDAEHYTGALIRMAEGAVGIAATHALATGAIAKYSTTALGGASATDTLVNSYRGLRLALSPTLFTAASVGVGILVEETLRLVSARGRLIEQQSLIAASSGLKFGDVERIGLASQFSGANSADMRAAVKALEDSINSKKTQGALSNIGVAAYMQGSASPQLLAEIAQKFADIPDPVKRAQAAVDLFGADLAGKVLPQLNQHFADSSKAIDDWALTLDDKTRNQVYAFRQDIQNLKDSMFGLGTGFSAAAQSAENFFVKFGAKGYAAGKDGFNAFANAVAPGQRSDYGTLQNNLAEAPGILKYASDQFRKNSLAAGDQGAAGILGEHARALMAQTPQGRTQIEAELSKQREAQAAAAKVLGQDSATPSQTVAAASGYTAATETIKALTARLVSIDDARHQSEALLSSRKLLDRSTLDTNAGKDIQGEIQKSTQYVDSDGQIHKIQLLDETRRNLTTAFDTWARSLNGKASADEIKNEQENFARRMSLEEMFWKRRQSFQDETARMEISTIAATFARQNTLAGFSRDERLKGLPTLDPNSPYFVRGQLSQITGQRDIEKSFINSTTLNDADTIRRNQERDINGVNTALAAGNINGADAKDRIDAIVRASGEAGAALDDTWAHQLAMADLDAQRGTQAVIREVGDKQVAAIGSFAGGLFGAATGGHAGSAIQSFLKSQALDFGRTVTENIAKQKLLPEFKKLIPGSGNPLLEGTFLFDPLKTAGVSLNDAGIKLNIAADKLVSVTGGASGAIGASGSGGTSSYLGAVAKLFNFGKGGGSDTIPAADWAQFTTGSSGFDPNTEDLGALSAQRGTMTASAPLKGGGLSTMGKVGAGIGAAGSAYQAFSDFRSGGAKNDIAGVGAGLAAAAGIAAMTGAAPVALGLAVAAAATDLVAAVLPDPKQMREQGIQKALAQAQYIAPTQLNVTQDTSGHYMDEDARGNLRQSDFSAVPTVSQGYLHWHGGYDGNQGFYVVPGQVTSPYSPAPGQQSAPTITIHLNAIDTQSGVEFLQKNSNVIGDAVATHLQNADGRLSAAIRYVAA